MPPQPEALPGNSTGKDRPAALWAVSDNGSAVTLEGTMSGGTTDGYWWGMRIPAFGLGPQVVRAMLVGRYIGRASSVTSPFGE